MRPILTALLALLLAACSAATTPFPSASDAPAPGEARLVIVDGDPGAGGITVAEALEHGPTDDIVSVTGALFVGADGIVRLCDAIAESFPPQCGGASLLVEGLDLSTIELEEANGVRWAESVTLLGSVE
jgi:hypothetical protein